MNTSYVACEYCDDSAPVSYYCETCHAMFCSNCLQTPSHQEKICGNCGSNLVLQDTNGTEFCQVCKSLHVGQIYRTLKVCPSCNAPTAVKIEQKKQDLVRDFFSVVQDTRHLLVPVNEMVNRFNNCRQKLLLLRSQIPPSNHFPTLEAELIKSASLVSQIKEGIVARIQAFFANTKRNLAFFSEDSMRPQDLPIIANTLASARAEASDLVTYGEHCLRKVDEDLETVKRRITFIEDVIEKFRPYLHLLDLDRQERPVFALECTLKAGVLEDQEMGKKSGLALLTNHKFSFTYEHGLIRKKNEILFQAPLNELTKAEIRGRFFKLLRLDFNNAYYKLSLAKDDRTKLLQYIDLARDFDEKNKVDQDKLSELTQLRLSGRDLRQLVEEQINGIIHAKIIDRRQSRGGYTLGNSPYAQEVYAPRLQVPPNYPAFVPAGTPAAADYGGEGDLDVSYGPSPSLYPATPTYGATQAPAYIPRNPYNPYPPSDPRAIPPGPAAPYRPRPPPIVRAPVPQPAGSPNISAGNWSSANPEDGEVFLDEKRVILKLEQESFAIQQTLSMLDQKFRNSEITQVDFLRTFRSLNQELFTIKRQLSMLKEKQVEGKPIFEPDTTGIL